MDLEKLKQEAEQEFKEDQERGFKRKVKEILYNIASEQNRIRKANKQIGKYQEELKNLEFNGECEQ
jgi:hypothetical protein